jgi:hypothetical protein
VLILWKKAERFQVNRLAQEEKLAKIQVKWMSCRLWAALAAI